MAQVSGGVTWCEDCGDLAEFAWRVHPMVEIFQCRACARQRTKNYLRLAPRPMRRKLLDAIERFSEPLFWPRGNGGTGAGET
jgi:hypothetical protein